jgi:hypothetical protein
VSACRSGTLSKGKSYGAGARLSVGRRAPPGWRSNAYSGVASQQQDAIAEAPVTSHAPGFLFVDRVSTIEVVTVA